MSDSRLPTPPRSRWRDFSRLIADADELVAYTGGLGKLRRGDDEDDYRQSDDIEREADEIEALVVRVRVGLAQFDRADNYEVDDGERVLKGSHVAKRLSIVAGAFPAGAPATAPTYLRVALEHVAAIEGLSELALESGCRAIETSAKFLPATSELVAEMASSVARWRTRMRALECVETMRSDTIRVLRSREKRQAEERRAQEIAEARGALTQAEAAVRALSKRVDDASALLAAAVKTETEAKRNLQRLFGEANGNG